HFLQGNLPLQVLLGSVVAGVIITLLPLRAKERSIAALSMVCPYMFRALHIIMWLAPLAALGGMATTIGKFGLAALWPLAKLMLSVYITMALFVFVVLWGLMRYYRVSLWRFLVYIRAELLVVLGASSSEAALPALMEKLERMGCSKPIVGLVVPAGYSFNLDGTTIYLSMATIFLAQVYNVDLSWWQLLTIIGVLMLTSKGAAGVTGMGFVVLVSTLSAVKVIPIEGVVLLFGVDRFMSEARAITNFIGNGVASVVLANHEKAFDRSKMLAELYPSTSIPTSQTPPSQTLPKRGSAESRSDTAT
ncbi:MAG: cation:dicarboxylase symporter family transporter, partial [Pirellulaceae bacterium]|nr:cation:dicarboxylase symporter family transporter [Pirellulaceae bacterium]